MKIRGITFGFLTLFGCLALAAQNPEIQQKAAAAKEAAARNQQALRSYSWITKTELSLKGEVKNTKIESCQYGPDGKVQKTELSEPPPPPEKNARPQGKDDREEDRRDEEGAPGLRGPGPELRPPLAGEDSSGIAAGKLTISPGAATAIRFADYEKAGDSLTLTMDSAVEVDAPDRRRHVARET